MADSVSMEVNSRSLKNLKLDNPGEESKSSTKYPRLCEEDRESDEYMRQYALFHYDFYRTQGFGIEWDKFDFSFSICFPYHGTPRLVWQRKLIKEETIDAIAYYNKKNGTNIVFVKHIDANFAFDSFLVEHWITFWAMDMSSICREPKIYQTYTKRWERGGKYLVPIFRVKPTEEEMAATPIHVDPPYPYCFVDHSKPLVVFSLAGPGDDPIPGTPFIFKRVPLLSVPPTPPNSTNLPPWRLEGNSHYPLPMRGIRLLNGWISLPE